LCDSEIEKFFLLNFVSRFCVCNTYNYVKTIGRECILVNTLQVNSKVDGINLSYYDATISLVPQFPEYKYFLDFALVLERNGRVICCDIECDGNAFHNTYEAKLRDKKRARDLAKIGWLTERFSGHEIRYNKGACSGRILRMIGWLSNGY
jgi:very-short-patch-repair endonuclease